ncbi:MAG: Adenylate cyclase, partial [uncultured Acetobacteraceae bacterium]
GLDRPRRPQRPQLPLRAGGERAGGRPARRVGHPLFLPPRRLHHLPRQGPGRIGRGRRQRPLRRRRRALPGAVLRRPATVGPHRLAPARVAAARRRPAARGRGPGVPQAGGRARGRGVAPAFPHRRAGRVPRRAVLGAAAARGPAPVLFHGEPARGERRRADARPGASRRRVLRCFAVRAGAGRRPADGAALRRRAARRRRPAAAGAAGHRHRFRPRGFHPGGGGAAALDAPARPVPRRAAAGGPVPARAAGALGAAAPGLPLRARALAARRRLGRARGPGAGSGRGGPAGHVARAGLRFRRPGHGRGVARELHQAARPAGRRFLRRRLPAFRL